MLVPVQYREYEYGLLRRIPSNALFFHASYQVFNSLTCFTGLVRSLPSEEYLATVNDESTGSITCLSCTQATRDQVTLHRMCTGGMELKLWDQLPSSMVKKRARLVRCFFATNIVLAVSK